MIVIILYTMLLLFTDRTAAGAQCLQALKQWYETMIPALFPMMLLSNITVDTGFAEKIGVVLNRTLLGFLKISDNGCYCLLTGFFFGFPMGAKTTADMLKKERITAKEGEYLLSFINCIGPMYTVQFIHSCFPEHALWKLIAGIYGISLFYGLFVRFTLYRTESFIGAFSGAGPLSFVDALYECVPKCGKSILLLGGYMVLFQISFVTLSHFLMSINMQTEALYPLLEITGGLSMQDTDTPLSRILLYTNLGGACCLVQTYSFLKPAGLSMKKYTFHKLILSLLSFILGMVI